MKFKILHLLGNGITQPKAHCEVPPARIVKGGSWADGLVHILCRSREVYNENTQSSKIGFRVAMDVVREK